MKRLLPIGILIVSLSLIGILNACQAFTSSTPNPERVVLTAVPDTEAAPVTPEPTVPRERPTATPGPAPAPTAIPPVGFSETFDGRPIVPESWTSPDNWDVSIHSRDVKTWASLDPINAHYGPNCEPYPATHTTTQYEHAVFRCDERLITALDAQEYGVVYLTPNQILDFSEEEAVIRFDVSTARSSERDWIDFWITPYEEHLQYPVDEWLPDLTGVPRNSIHIRLDGHNISRWWIEITRDFEVIKLEGTDRSYLGYESILIPTYSELDTYELRISDDHIKFGLPDYGFWWVDEPLEDLGWSTGIVQFGHHSYVPQKSCESGNTCTGNSWYWDNFYLHPTQPFSIIQADRRFLDFENQSAVYFEEPAPANSHVRFAGIGNNLEVSFDQGITWLPAEASNQTGTGDEKFKSYWMSVPPGTISFMARGEKWWGGPWHIRDISIWSMELNQIVELD